MNWYIRFKYNRLLETKLFTLVAILALVKIIQSLAQFTFITETQASYAGFSPPVAFLLTPASVAVIMLIVCYIYSWLTKLVAAYLGLSANDNELVKTYILIVTASSIITTLTYPFHAITSPYFQIIVTSIVISGLQFIAIKKLYRVNNSISFVIGGFTPILGALILTCLLGIYLILSYLFLPS